MEGIAFTRFGLGFFGDEFFCVIELGFEIFDEGASVSPAVFKKRDEYNGENQEQGDPEYFSE